MRVRTARPELRSRPHPCLPHRAHTNKLWLFADPLTLFVPLQILSEKIVYDDMVHRAWYADEGLTQGLLFACKQAQVNLDKPVGEQGTG